MSYEKLRLIVLNGPPRSGKDSLADAILSRYIGRKFALAEPLKRAVHAFFDEDLDIYKFEPVKEKPIFEGVSPRNAYIEMFTGFAEPTFGPSILGKLLAKKTKAYFCGQSGKLNVKDNTVVVIGDCGRPAELIPLLCTFPIERVMLVQMHRENFTYEKDIRQYINLPDILHALAEQAFKTTEELNLLRSVADLKIAKITNESLAVDTKDPKHKKVLMPHFLKMVDARITPFILGR